MQTYVANPYSIEVECITCSDQLTGDGLLLNEENYDGGTYWNEQGQVVIYVPNKDVETLAHECFHAVMFIAEYTGIEPFASYSEPLAYLFGHMFNHFYKEFYVSKA